MDGGGGIALQAAEETLAVESREWFLSAYAPEGVPTSDHLKLRSVSLTLSPDSIPDQHVVLQLLYTSIDPYLRSRMTGNEEGLYSTQFALGRAIEAYGIGRVIRSKDSNFCIGDIVVNPFTPVAEYSLVPTVLLRKIDPTAGISLLEYLNCLGVPGFTAWVGIELIGKPKPGSNVFISAAAGGVGMFAGQLAKIKGCRVIGSTGSDEKVKLLKEQFGYDDAFNYHKETDFDAALTKYFPDGIDVYFDNVGGKMLEAVLNHINKGACIPLCVMISQYNKVWREREGVRNLLNLVGKEGRMEGFMIGSYLDRFGDFAVEMEGHIKQGKINSKYLIVKGIDTFLESLTSVFSSSNVGKLILQLN